MVGIHDFIITVEKEYNDTFETENGLKLYADKKFSQDKLANRIAEVLEVPKTYNGPIKKGMQIFVDHTIFLRETYQAHGEIENVFTVDKQKGLYKINDQLIYMYRDNEFAKWKGNNDNLFVEEVVEDSAEEKVGSIILAVSKPIRKGVHKVVYDNDLLNEMGVKKGKQVLIDMTMRMPISIDGKQYYQLNNRDVLAVYKS